MEDFVRKIDVSDDSDEEVEDAKLFINLIKEKDAIDKKNDKKIADEMYWQLIDKNKLD